MLERLSRVEEDEGISRKHLTEWYSRGPRAAAGKDGYWRSKAKRVWWLAQQMVCFVTGAMLGMLGLDERSARVSRRRSPVNRIHTSEETAIL